jgi:lysine 2,3-aminomutase
LNTAPVTTASTEPPSSTAVTTRTGSRSRRRTEPIAEPGSFAAPEEPPGRPRIGRQRFFPAVTDADWNNWKWQFRHRITFVDQLSTFIPLSPEERTRVELVTKRYPMAITPYYLSLIDPDNPRDPVRRQAVPAFEEVTLGCLGMEDPLGERVDSAVPGLVHRYPDRALMVLTDICPMLCRHCTRKREWRHGAWTRTSAEIEAMLDFLRRTPAIRDFVISGGDPLTLSTAALESVISRVRAIPHIEIIRIGTRFPVVAPQRIDAELCEMLSKHGPIWLNTHFNHPNEITPDSMAAVDRLLRAGVPVNNQSVLLKGVNDSVETMTKLVHGLLRSKVRPYYLYQCDEVQGTEHLRTTVETGIRIIEGMRGHTSGLAIPTFVVDLVQGGGKVPLQPNYVLSMTDEELIIKNYEGQVFRYRNPDACPAKDVSGTPVPVSGVVESLLEAAERGTI